MTLRLVDYLVLVTDAFGESLFLLAGLLGEERALRILEEAAEEESSRSLDPELLAGFRIPPEDESSGDGEGSDPYSELQLKIDRLRHHPQIEFYVWSYVGYRVWAESEVTLDQVWRPKSRELVERLERDAVDRFEAWYRRLGIPEVIEAKCFEVLIKPWKKFQHELYKAAGHAPFKLVSTAGPGPNSSPGAGRNSGARESD